jgi:hypothetical protein
MTEKKCMLDDLLNQGDRSLEEAFRMAMEESKDFDPDVFLASMISEEDGIQRLYDDGVRPCDVSGDPAFIKKYTDYYFKRQGGK